MLVAFKSLK